MNHPESVRKSCFELFLSVRSSVRLSPPTLSRAAHQARLKGAFATACGHACCGRAKGAARGTRGLEMKTLRLAALAAAFLVTACGAKPVEILQPVPPSLRNAAMSR